MKENILKTISIYQPVFFPWLGFFHKLHFADTWIVLDDCKAIKQSWMNRVYIKTNKDKSWLTVPVYFKHRSHQLVREMRIDYQHRWVVKHIRTIKQYYGNAPYFDEIYEVFMKVLEKRPKFLIDLDMDGILKIIDLLSINIKIKFSSKLDYINSDGTQRLINIIKTVDGESYFCGMGSDSYLKPELFKKNLINLKYQQYKMFPYSQQGNGGFLEGLSILDTFANIGKQGISEIFKKNDVLNQ
jgi:hypothetical protein